jgi:hypothetical protein
MKKLPKNVVQLMIAEQMRFDRLYGTVGLEECSIYPLHITEKVIEEATEDEQDTLIAIHGVVNNILEDADEIVRRIKQRIRKNKRKK